MPFNFDTIALKSFITVAETKSFSNAAKKVGRTQPAVSLQIKKLEDSLGVELFDRAGRQVKLTEQGEVFLGYCKRIIQLQWDAYSLIREPDIEGEINLGTPEDFATHYLPEVLATFSKNHPRVQLNVFCDLTLNLIKGFDQGNYDIVLIKRDPKIIKDGIKVWKEPLVWGTAANRLLEEPLPLVLSPQPCIYRARALSTLDSAKIPWRISYTSPSFAGTIAAVKAGLGITVLPRNMIPAGVQPLLNNPKLPELPDAEIALLKRTGLLKAGNMLAEHIIYSLERS